MRGLTWGCSSGCRPETSRAGAPRRATAAPSPARIAAIADAVGDPAREAAIAAFVEFGEALGAAIADAVTLIDDNPEPAYYIIPKIASAQ